MLNKYNLACSYALSLIDKINIDNLIYYEDWIDYFKCLINIFNIKNINKFILINKKFSIIFFITIFRKIKNFNNLMESFLNIVIQDNVFNFINLVYKYFIKLVKLRKSSNSIIIYYSNKFNKKNIILIKNFIKKKFSLYKYKHYYFKYNKNIIAGFKVKINDFIIDNSLLNILNKIKLSILKRV